MAGEAAMDWRRHLQLNSRQRIVDRIMETPTMLREIAERIEQEAYTAAISQADYLQRLAMETMPQNPIGGGGGGGRDGGGGGPPGGGGGPPGGGPGEAAMDWRNQLGPNARQRMVDNIMRTPEGHLPVFGQEHLQEVMEIAPRLAALRVIAETFEQEAYNAAISHADYLQRLALGANQNP